MWGVSFESSEKGSREIGSQFPFVPLKIPFWEVREECDEREVCSGEKSRSVENLRHLRLMALLRDLIQDEGRMEAAEVLGVNYKTLANTVKTGWIRVRTLPLP